MTVSCCFFLFWSVYALYGMNSQSSYERQFTLFTAQSLLLFYLALESWRNNRLNLPIMPKMEQTKTVETISPDDNEDARQTKLHSLWQNCITRLQSNYWYKEPDLTLSKLAKRLGTNTTSLSKALNQYEQENFNSIINKLRVEFVCSKITEGHHDIDFLNLAYQAGFNSKNSFNRNFKRFTGKTPTQFKHQIIN